MYILFNSQRLIISTITTKKQCTHMYLQHICTVHTYNTHIHMYSTYLKNTHIYVRYAPALQNTPKHSTYLQHTHMYLKHTYATYICTYLHKQHLLDCIGVLLPPDSSSDGNPQSTNASGEKVQIKGLTGLCRHCQIIWSIPNYRQVFMN